MKQPIVDAHLDIALNALLSDRDLSLTVTQIRSREPDPATVAMTSLPALGEASVAVAFATLYVFPANVGALGDNLGFKRPIPVYRDAAEAESQALDQLRIYERWAEEGRIRVIRSGADLESHLAWFGEDRIPGFVIAMEGADPVLEPEALSIWFERGVRVISLAWESTRYAGGTGSTSGLTEQGRELLAAMAELNIIHDAVHLSEEAFWEALGLPHRGLCVSHANPRALMLPTPGDPVEVPLNRFLSDEQITEVARPRGAASRGMVGLTLLNEFLEPRWNFSPGGREVAVSLRRQVAAHLNHLARLAGWESVGIGSDVDVGYGRDETPSELDSILNWEKVGDVVPDAARAGVLGGNWLRFLRETLPYGG